MQKMIKVLLMLVAAALLAECYGRFEFFRLQPDSSRIVDILLPGPVRVHLVITALGTVALLLWVLLKRGVKGNH